MMPFRRIALWVVAVGTLASILVLLTVDGLRWRAKVTIHKASGGLGEVSWRELARLVRPGSELYLEDVARTGSLYASVKNPHDGPADLDAGRNRFDAQCAQCHGADGHGGTGPDLRRGVHGASDWATYRAIRDGIPETPMSPSALDDREVWRLVAWVQEIRREVGPAFNSTATVPWTVAPVSAAMLANPAGHPESWITYNGSYSSWRHSTLRDIGPANVGRLRLEWAYQLEAPDARVETSPLVVGDMMYLTEPDNRVVALDARSGEMRWSRRVTLAPTLSLCCGRVNRGLGIADTTLFLGTLDARLIALDAATGRSRWEVALGDPAAGHSITSAPLVIGNLVIIGVAGGEFGIRGFVDAYDTRSGQRRWRFYTIPGPGERNNDTWQGSSWKTGGGPAWLTGSYDPDLNLLYVGVGNPGPLYNDKGRTGDNLYTNSVVAIRLDTGTLAWHFQFTPHDTHDYDAVQVPLLVDARWKGRPRRLMLWANRNAFYYVLDRETGEFLAAREFARQTWADGLDSTGRPIPRPGAKPSPRGVLVYPSYLGATNWWSPSYHPGTGLVYVPTREQGAVFYSGEANYRPGHLFRGSRGEALYPGALTALRALDALTGAQRWEYVFGSVSNAAEMFAVGGALSTASGLVFAGAGTHFVALDAETGAPHWRLNLGGNIAAAPITWKLDGRQRVTLVAGHSVFTFSLD